MLITESMWRLLYQKGIKLKFSYKEIDSTPRHNIKLIPGMDLTYPDPNLSPNSVPDL